MVYSRDKIEQIVIGTLLNDYGEDNFMEEYNMSLRKELFADKKNAFIFGLIEDMYNNGIKSTTPFDVLKYASGKKIKFRDIGSFICYMCRLANENYAFRSFKDYVKELVVIFIKEKKAHGEL